MRALSLRLIVALIVGVTLVSLASSWYEVQAEKDALRRDLQHKAETFGESVASNAELYLEAGDRLGLEQMVQRFSNRDHLLGIGIYNADGSSLAMTPDLSAVLSDTPAGLTNALRDNRVESGSMRLHFRRVYMLAAPLHLADKSVAGGIIIVYDTAYIRAAIFRVWGRVFVHIAIQMLVIVGLTLLILRWSLTGPIARAALWMKALRTGRNVAQPLARDLDFLLPLTREVAPLAASMKEAREAAEIEARLRNTNESRWTAQRLADHVRSKLNGSNLFVVSNREPYIHNRQGNTITVTVPASGLVTAIEPILCACNGTWVAHGSGNADAETVDSNDRLKVPPDDPRYTLRRVWLSAEEEEGYYNGFANEGLWPLCHMAHTRPTFRASDWEHYNQVNQRFADALVEEMAGEEHPVVLIQDYHFALLPRMVKDRLPHARIAIFWHIPWPNSEAFSICPWQQELLDGLLGADLIGFHVQAHCNNFLNTVDRVLEARVDREHFSVKRNNHWSSVLPFPISVESSDEIIAAGERNAEEERSALIAELGIEATFLGVGVDRVDYTKGIIERFLAVESFLERYPRYQGKFTFIQIGAPTRSRIQRYADFQAEVEAEANRINDRFRRGKWRPIVFLNRQHTHQEVRRYYRAAHVCMVTSLHDGMNLVAKEYVAARHDERGVLILSRFTGAARDLLDAIIVNPYDIQSTADAIAQALNMDIGEMIERMQRMRKSVKEHNIYWWAGSLIGDLCDLRIKKAKNTKSVKAFISKKATKES
ncbi:MAG: trehalose-6-phosphate synthase [Acidobacteriales bacterium 59-55]|nr:trehalose-6-phosphate synthase [Terriglobales bacterium]OJV41757.1 MAG: trehalose-6-phosphate synthase [Acidobacteriales bacterium 59-55]